MIAKRLLTAGITLVLMMRAVAHAAEPHILFEKRAGSISIKIDAIEVATYIYHDPQVSHPYFANVKTADGIQVTRHHPLRKDVDAADHPGLHTGIWLSFGDLSGCDYWRLKAKTEHVRFVTEPASDGEVGKFAVLNRYLSPNGQDTVCEETCRYSIKMLPQGYLIDMLGEFRSDDHEFFFGDQEEMGLAVRMATPLAVDRKQGGRILDSHGRQNGAEVWGKTADWCDYSGPLDGKWVGITVLTGKENFRPCWCHARDYGFLTMNPFGKNAFTKSAPSKVVVKPGETFRLHYGVVVHSSATDKDYHPADAYEELNAKK